MSVSDDESGIVVEGPNCIPVDYRKLTDERVFYKDAVVVGGYIDRSGLPEAITTESSRTNSRLEVFGKVNEAQDAAEWILLREGTEAKVYVGAAVVLRVRATAIPPA
ncbi:hypothetical protein AURDEDRAFT_144673 [Auricularia subglabra TFB-10046 SS5]|nr:hypothetical protein AURDEDRAFT_144673 [Auricularia subglabra TFB-10046 SS5]